MCPPEHIFIVDQMNRLRVHLKQHICILNKSGILKRDYQLTQEVLRRVKPILMLNLIWVYATLEIVGFK